MGFSSNPCCIPVPGTIAMIMRGTTGKFSQLNQWHCAFVNILNINKVEIVFLLILRFLNEKFQNYKIENVQGWLKRPKMEFLMV